MGGAWKTGTDTIEGFCVLEAAAHIAGVMWPPCGSTRKS